MTKQNFHLALFILICIQFVLGDFQEFLKSANYTDTEENIDYEALTKEYNGELSVETVKKIRKCERNAMLMELCMRCAIITKAVLVYPMCCDNEEDVGKWCYDYVNYGSSVPMTDEEIAAVPLQ